jgi:hypothetical protein
MTSLQKNQMAKSAPMNKQATRFLFTLCHPTPEEIATIHARKEKIKSIIAEIEIAPTRQMAHLRGYFEVENRIRLNTAKKFISERCYIEIAQGTREQNIAYCSKNTNVIIFKEQETQSGNGTDFSLVIS